MYVYCIQLSTNLLPTLDLVSLWEFEKDLYQNLTSS
jgi:hypothetical protein